MGKFTNRAGRWGDFVDVKTNAPEVLARQVQKVAPGGEVIMSSVCDGWQSLEEKERISRRCLGILVDAGMNVSILTKNALVERDFDIMARGSVELGVTITTLDERVRRVMEPGASPANERLAVLRKAAAAGIRVWAFVGPVLPGISDSEEAIDDLFASVAALPLERLYFDRLNSRYGVWQSMRSTLDEHFPSLVPLYRRLFFESTASARYGLELGDAAAAAAKRRGLGEKLKICS
jgi:DNA repair photolyase